jgi:hypothetical protein
VNNPAFTPESLFRVSAIGTRDDSDDRHVAPGAQLRSWVAPALGFPLHPFTFYPVRPEYLDPDGSDLIGELDVTWWVREGSVTKIVGVGSAVDVGAFGVVYGDITGVAGQTDQTFDPWISWITLDVAGSSHLELAVLGRVSGKGERKLLRRSAEPYNLGATRITRIMLTGDGKIDRVRGLNAARLGPDHVFLDAGAVVEMPLPLETPSVWAVSPIGGEGGMNRVTAGAPVRSGPPDTPDNDKPLTGTDERDRVEALVRQLGPTSAKALLETSYQDDATPATQRRTQVEISGGDHSALADVGNIETLFTAAADPGIARWLGLSAYVDADPGDDKRPKAWIACGVWAVDDSALITKSPSTTVRDILEAAGMTVADIGQPWTNFLPTAGALSPNVAVLQGRGLTVVRLATPATFGALPDVPTAPQLTPGGPGAGGGGEWNGADSYIQDLDFAGPAPTGPIGFTRSVGGGPPVSMHEHLDASIGPPRALTMLAGRAATIGGSVGSLSDLNVPANLGGVVWHAAESDEFGRWGPAGSLAAVVPPRPSLPAPQVQTLFDSDHQRDGPPGPRSPGTITIRVDTPNPSALGPGCPPLELVRINVPGQTPDDHPAPVPGDALETTVPAPETEVGESTTCTVTVVFNPDQPASPSRQATLTVTDPRRPAPLDTAPTVLWATRKNAVGQAEIDVTWAAHPGHSGYKVYLADENVLTAELDRLGVVISASPNRATRVESIYGFRNLPFKREAFTLISEAPLSAAGGTVRWRHAVPGSLQTLQFIRVVPVASNGAEAQFDSCGLIAVAVPTADQPPPPGIDMKNNGDSGIELSVSAAGIAEEVLDRLRAGSTASPEYQLRCTAADSDPAYQTVISSGDLEAVPANTYQAPIPPGDLASLPRYVPLSFTAQVRYPGEVSERPGAVPIPSPVSATWGPDATTPHPSEWSAPSTSVTTLITAPTPQMHAVAQGSATGADLVFTALPTAHPLQVAPWRIRTWRRLDSGELELLEPGDLDITADPSTGPSGDGWTVSQSLTLHDARGHVVAYLAVLVDPIGRTGAPTEFTVSHG